MKTEEDDIKKGEYNWMFCHVCGPEQIIGGTCASCGSKPKIYLEDREEVLEASNGHREEYRNKLNELIYES